MLTWASVTARFVLADQPCQQRLGSRGPSAAPGRERSGDRWAAWCSRRIGPAPAMRWVCQRSSVCGEQPEPAELGEQQPGQGAEDRPVDPHQCRAPIGSAENRGPHDAARGSRRPWPRHRGEQHKSAQHASDHEVGGVDAVRLSSKTSLSTCRRIRYSSRSDTGANMPDRRMPLITAGQQRWPNSGTPQASELPRGRRSPRAPAQRVLRSGECGVCTACRMVCLRRHYRTCVCRLGRLGGSCLRHGARSARG